MTKLTKKCLTDVKQIVTVDTTDINTYLSNGWKLIDTKLTTKKRCLVYILAKFHDTNETKVSTLDNYKRKMETLWLLLGDKVDQK